jgi:hypothetical protein
MQDREPSGSKRCVNQPVPLGAIGSLMTRVVEFDDKQRLHRLWGAQDEVDMFAIDAIRVAHVVTTIGDVDQVRDADLGADGVLVPANAVQHVIERQLGRGQEVVLESIWEFLSR